MPGKMKFHGVKPDYTSTYVSPPVMADIEAGFMEAPTKLLVQFQVEITCLLVMKMKRVCIMIFRELKQNLVEKKYFLTCGG